MTGYFYQHIFNPSLIIYSIVVQFIWLIDQPSIILHSFRCSSCNSTISFALFIFNNTLYHWYTKHFTLLYVCIGKYQKRINFIYVFPKIISVKPMANQYTHITYIALVEVWNAVIWNKQTIYTGKCGFRHKPNRIHI